MINLKDSLIGKWSAKHPFIASIVAMILISCFIIFVVILGTSLYTRHGQYRVVPELKGMTVDEAMGKLDELGLRYEVVDSVYSRQYPLGAIVELVPEVGSKVKPGRIIFITVNATTPQKGIIPDLKDLSLRQARYTLEGLGFTSITERYVDGEHQDLVTGIETDDGRSLAQGDRIELSTPLVICVSRKAVVTYEADSALLEKPDIGELDSVKHDKSNSNENWL